MQVIPFCWPKTTLQCPNRFLKIMKRKRQLQNNDSPKTNSHCSQPIDLSGTTSNSNIILLLKKFLMYTFSNVNNIDYKLQISFLSQLPLSCTNTKLL